MSFIVIQKLVIDFSQDAPYLYIGAKSGEINGRTIEFIPVIKGEPIDLSNIVSARFEGKKADGNVILLDGEIKEGHIFVTFTPQSVNVFGLVEAEIGLYGSNMDLAYSQYIYIDVYESIVGDHAHESFPELDSLRIALLTIDKEVKEAKDATKEAFLSAENVNSAAENLENLKTSTVEATENANQSAENANTEAKNALDASLLANEAAQAANEAKDSALSAAKSANDAADRATTIFDDAQSAISYANESAENANEAAGNANFVYEKASTIIPVMEELLEDSEDAIKNANSSAQNANTAANLASDAAQSANDAAVVAMNASKEAMLQEVRQNAVLATNNANNAAEEANQSAKDADLAKEDALLAKQEALSAAESARVEASNANVATQNANNAADAAIEASKEASLQAARDAANTAAESANAAADRATSFLDGAEAAENERNLNEIGRVSAEENRRKEFATWEIELGNISAFDKRIENLEAAVSPGLVTPTVDDSVAYMKDVPTGALPNAMISEIGGMTRKCTNLIAFNDKEFTLQGVTFNCKNGTLTVNGVVSGEISSGNEAFKSNFKFELPSGTYTVKSNGTTSTCFIKRYSDDAQFASFNYATGAKTFTLEERTELYTSFYMYNQSFNNEDQQIMLNKGDTALPYEPYFEGLRDAKVTAVESVGVNKLPYPYIETTSVRNGIAFTDNGDGSITLKGTATADAVFTLAENVNFGANTMSSVWSDSAENGEYYMSKMMVYSATRKRVTMNVSSGLTMNETLYPFICEVDKNRTYSPYRKHTLEIPEAVQALEGNGQGISKEYHNKIVLDPAEGVKKFVKNTKTVVFDGVNRKLSKNSGVADDNNYLYYGGLPEKADIGILPICDCLKSANPLESNSIGWYSDTYIVYAQLESVAKIVGNNESAINEWLVENPMTVCYALATPTETDISDYFGDDNLIGVEAGGTVTMANEYGYDVPSVIEYTVKGSDAT